jgi:hypothetical protein
MNRDRLTVKILIGRIGGRAPGGRPHKAWIEYTREDLARLSELHGVRGTYINWWVRCKVWAIDIHKFDEHTTHAERGQFRLECVSVKRQVPNNRLAGPVRLMDDTVFGGGIVRRVSRLVLTRTCLRRTWHEALSCPVWIDSHVYMPGFRTHLSSYRWSRCTPSLRMGNV